MKILAYLMLCGTLVALLSYIFISSPEGKKVIELDLGNRGLVQRVG